MITSLLSNLPIFMVAIFVGFGGFLILNDEKRHMKKHGNPKLHK